MITRMIAMAGAASVLLASPAWSGESTPAEKEATRQLNLQAAQDAKPSPATPERVTAAPSGTLSEILNPPSKIASANVLDATGKTVGAVQRVEVTPDGKPTRVTIAMAGTKDQVVVLDASAMNYDAHKNELTATSGLPANG